MKRFHDDSAILAQAFAASVPLTVGDTNALIGLALGAAALMLVLPPILVNLVLNSPGPLRVEQ